MALLSLVYYPDPRLRKKCVPVDSVDEKIQRLVDDMFETMYKNHGVGLAAPQIGINQQIAVIDASMDKSEPLCLINPKLKAQDKPVAMQEGCLSVPGIFHQVTRADKVVLQAQDREGKPYELEATGLLAECIQHEIDHLNGILCIDQLSPFKLDRVKKKLVKIKRLHGLD